MQLTTTTVRTSQLTWDAPTRRFVAEASELLTPSRVFDDACDLGYTLEGRRGEIVPMIESRYEVDRDGDVRYWDYVPMLAEDAKKFAGLRVFND